MQEKTFHNNTLQDSIRVSTTAFFLQNTKTELKNPISEKDMSQVQGKLSFSVAFSKKYACFLRKTLPRKKNTDRHMASFFQAATVFGL